jgi:hypothetical protein
MENKGFPLQKWHIIEAGKNVAITAAMEGISGQR